MLLGLGSHMKGSLGNVVGLGSHMKGSLGNVVDVGLSHERVFG